MIPLKTAGGKAAAILSAAFSLLLLFASTVPAQENQPVRTIRGYVTVGGGGGGDAKSANMHVEGGIYTVRNGPNFLFGLGIPYTVNRDETPSNLHDYSCPHSNWRDLGTKRKGEEVGLYGKVGIAPIRHVGFFIFGIGGFTSGKEIWLAQSNVTGWYYTESESTKTYGLYGGGIAFLPMQGHFTAHVQYDNRMGITGALGFAW